MAGMDVGADPEAAREALLRAAMRYREALLCHAHAILRDWPGAEDVVQDAFMVVLRKWESCTDPTGVYPWVRRIVVLRALEVARNRARARTTGGEAAAAAVAEAMAEEDDADGATRLAVLRDALALCMRGLDARALALVDGFYWQRLSCDDLANRHGRTVNAVRLALSRLRSRLRTCLERRVGTSAVAGFWGEP